MKKIYQNITCKYLSIYLENEFSYFLWKMNFRLLRRQDEYSQIYEDILQTTKSFTNRACVQTLYQRLTKRFEYLQPESNQSEPSNEILHMTLIESFRK